MLHQGRQIRGFIDKQNRWEMLRQGRQIRGFIDNKDRWGVGGGGDAASRKTDKGIS